MRWNTNALRQQLASKEGPAGTVQLELLYAGSDLGESEVTARIRSRAAKHELGRNERADERTSRRTVAHSTNDAPKVACRLRECCARCMGPKRGRD